MIEINSLPHLLASLVMVVATGCAPHITATAVAASTADTARQRHCRTRITTTACAIRARRRGIWTSRRGSSAKRTVRHNLLYRTAIRLYSTPKRMNGVQRLSGDLPDR